MDIETSLAIREFLRVLPPEWARCLQEIAYGCTRSRALERTGLSESRMPVLNAILMEMGLYLQGSSAPLIRERIASACSRENPLVFQHFLIYPSEVLKQFTIAAPPGSGKSTWCAAIQEWPYLFFSSDVDICANLTLPQVISLLSLPSPHKRLILIDDVSPQAVPSWQQVWQRLSPRHAELKIFVTDPGGTDIRWPMPALMVMLLRRLADIPQVQYLYSKLPTDDVSRLTTRDFAEVAWFLCGDVGAQRAILGFVDARGYGNPAAFLNAMQIAANKTRLHYPTYDYPLHPECVMDGIRKASHTWLAQLIGEQDWDVSTLVECGIACVVSRKIYIPPHFRASLQYKYPRGTRQFCQLKLDI